MLLWVGPSSDDAKTMMPAWGAFLLSSKAEKIRKGAGRSGDVDRLNGGMRSVCCLRRSLRRLMGMMRVSGRWQLFFAVMEKIRKDL